MKRSVRCDGGVIIYELERKRVKNINLRVKASGDVFVSASPSVPADFIDKFVISREGFIIRARERIKRQSNERSSEYRNGDVYNVFGEEMTLVAQRGKKCSVSFDGGRIIMTLSGDDNPQKREKILLRALAERLADIVEDLARRIYPSFSHLNIPFPKIRYRNMKSRWGSCHTSKHILTFSYMLTSRPVRLIEYVVLHEFCHFIHADHSAAFYFEMSRRMPDWKQRRAELKA